MAAGTLRASPTAAPALVHYPKASNGRWLVCYEVPGTTAQHVATDCLTLAGALAECERLNGHALTANPYHLFTTYPA